MNTRKIAELIKDIADLYAPKEPHTINVLQQYLLQIADQIDPPWRREVMENLFKEEEK